MANLHSRKTFATLFQAECLNMFKNTPFRTIYIPFTTPSRWDKSTKTEQEYTLFSQTDTKDKEKNEQTALYRRSGGKVDYDGRISRGQQQSKVFFLGDSEKRFIFARYCVHQGHVAPI